MKEPCFKIKIEPMQIQFIIIGIIYCQTIVITSIEIIFMLMYYAHSLIQDIFQVQAI